MVIGDVMIDRYISGSVDRISPEAPLPIVDVNHREDRLGGAANVALNVQNLGADVIMCSVLGNEEDSQAMLSLLHEKKIKTDGVLLDQNRITTVKTRIFSRQQQLLRFDEEIRSPLEEKMELAFIDKVMSLIDTQAPAVIILEDYNKGVLTKKVIQEVLSGAKRKSIPTVVDPKTKNFFAYKNCTLFKPNLKEAEEGLGESIDANNEINLQVACSHIQQKLNNKNTVLTLGSKGMFVYGSSKGELIPTISKNVYDVSGAGDTVVSVLAMGLALKLDLVATAELANIAAEQVCGELGVKPVNREKLIEEAERILG